MSNFTCENARLWNIWMGIGGKGGDTDGSKERKIRVTRWQECT